MYHLEHASRHHPARRPPDGFYLETLQASYFFYIVRRALYLSGQLKLPIYPVNRVNSKKEYPENAARY
jgi:hypothetical protein